MLPKEPIHHLTKPLTRFMHVEAASGLVLLACSVFALVAANSEFSENFLKIWKTPIHITIGSFQLHHPLKHWINDGLMAIFFFVIGLEVKREIVLGELQDVRRAALPVAAALGGMIIPAGLYLSLQSGELGQRGWGIPMATDIAFVVGCIAILGSRVPPALRVILLSLAIVDDIGAILVIAFGYTDSLQMGWLLFGVTGISLIVLMQRLGIRSMGAYTLVGFLIWLGFHESGIHATIAGVALGLLTPAHAYINRSWSSNVIETSRKILHGELDAEPDANSKVIVDYLQFTREKISPLDYLIHLLHPWVSFLILPLFALANAGIPFKASEIFSPVAVAVIFGLVVGKPMGILLFSWLWLKIGKTGLPDGIHWRHMTGGGFLAGIGFTMAIFITGLAFREETLMRTAKVGVLVASGLSAVIGMTILGTASPSSRK